MSSEKVKVLITEKDGKINFECEHCQRNGKMTAPQGGIVFRVKCKCGESQRIVVEHRKSRRKKFETIGGISIDSKDKLNVQIRDLSLGGMAFDSLHIIDVGRELSISFTLNISRRDEELTAELTLKIVSKNGSRYGAEFLNLPDYSQVKKDIFWWLKE